MKSNDLISRAAAIEAFDDERVDRNYGDVSPESVIGVIESIPAVDAVPVIRCRDCEHFIDMSGTSYPSYCYKHTTSDADGEFDNVFSTEPDKYCAWGERRESE